VTPAERRRENVRILLRTLNEPYSPKSSRPLAESGLAPSRFIPCPDCRHNRRVGRGCLACDGRGYRPRRKGDPEVDGYAAKPVTVEPKPRVSPMSPARLDAALAAVTRNLLAYDGLIDPYEAEGWEREVEARNRSGSYQALERALDRMQLEIPLGRSFITWVYFSGLAPRLNAAGRHLDDLLVDWLAARMPGKIWIPKPYFDAQQAERAQRVRELLAAGWEEDAICAEVGVSRKLVRAEAAATLRVSSTTRAGNGEAPVRQSLGASHA